MAVLSAAGWLGGRVEPFVGPLVLPVAAAPLVVLQPDRRRLLTVGPGASRPLVAMAAVAAGPAAVYVADMLGRARAAGPSCFLGQCVQGDRYAEAAALALAVVLVAMLASMQTSGVAAFGLGLRHGCSRAPCRLSAVSCAGRSSRWRLGRGDSGWGGAFIAVAELEPVAARPRAAEREDQGALRLAHPAVAMFGRRQTAAIWANLEHILESATDDAVP